MKQNIKLNRSLEKIIGIFILILLVIVALSVFLIQSRFDLTRFGRIEKVDLSAQQSNDSIVLLPDGYQSMTPPETYDSETLYEKINGKAPLYTDAGFVRLDFQRFAKVSNPQLWFQVYRYDMAKGENAFSVFSVQRRSDSIPIPGIEDFSYRTENSAYLASEKYYYEIIAAQQDEQVMSDILAYIVTLVPQGKLPVDVPELKSLQLDSLVSGSRRVYLKDAIGFPGFNNVYLASYNRDDPITAFVHHGSSSDSVLKTLTSCVEFMTENGAENVEVASLDSQAVVFDNYGAYEILMPVGNYLIGIHEAYELDTAIELLNKLKQNIIDQGQTDE